ncbi:MAG TPA: PEP-CTERM sorting domain-containing protein [Steroidobacteraceae bacterium]
MTFRIKPIVPIVFLMAASAQAAPTVSVSTFATGGAVSATNPDSITTGDGSVWIEYGNSAVSTGGTGSSTIVRYSPSGAIQHVFTIAGLVDGLKVNPVTGMLWALQNNDGNSTLSLINPTNNTVGAALMYKSPPYVYGANSARGYDDVAFLNGKVYLSYTNPVNPGDSVVQMLNQGNNPSGTLTTSNVINAQQTNPAFTMTGQAPPDIDSLKSTPSGQLVLTSEGDAGVGPPQDGRFTLISNPDSATPTVTNVIVNNATGANANAMDDVLFPGATAGTLYVSDTKTNTVYAIQLTGLDPNTPIISLGSFGEVALVDPVTGVVGMSLLGGLSAPHGLDFVAATTSAPEPSTWPMLLLGLGGLAMAAAGRRNKAASHLATAN